MTEDQAVAAAKRYLLAWHRARCSAFEAEYFPVNTSDLLDNRATWRVTFSEPSLGHPEGDVAWVYVDKATGEVWEINRSTGLASPRSWHDAWAVKKLEKMQKDWDRKVKDYRRRQTD